jgi:MFS family permease
LNGKGGRNMSEAGKFKWFYFIRYFGDALFYPFMTLYFVSKGINEEQIGIILAITPIVTIFSNPIWNYLVKDNRISHWILKIMTIVEGLLIILVTQVSTFELYALLIAIVGILCSPYYSIQDGFTATFANKNHIEYSSIRIYASIAYVVATALAGLMVQYLNYEILILSGGIGFLVTAIFAWWIKPLGTKNEIEEQPKRDLKGLLKNKEFYKYLLFYTLVAGTVRVGDSFLNLYMTKELHLDIMAWGFVYSGFVFVEVLVLRYLSLKGSLMDERKLFAIGTFLFVLRFLAYCIPLPVPVLIAMTMLRGISWGIYLYTHIRYITKIVKMGNITAAILIITLMYSIFTAVGNILSGWLIKAYGYPLFFIVQTTLVFLGFVSFLVLTPKIKQSPANE